MIVVSLALGLLGAVLLLATVSDLVSLIRLLASPGARRTPAAPARPRFLFLIPAHDEELLLGACLESVQGMRYPPELLDVVVIADNCRDSTADIARAAGVRCLVRTAPADPGKPRAIAWALAQLQVGDYDGIVIVDADTEVDRDFAAQLATAAPLADKALQPYNGVSNRSANALTRMAAVLSAANHGLAYVLKTRAALNVPLSVGMCIGSRVLGPAGWTATSLCEDWELYALLTERGVRIEGVPRARIYAQEAPTLRASSSQRRRWTAGKLALLVKHAWPLIRSHHAGVTQKLDSIAELSGVGPVLHSCIVTLAIAVTLFLQPPAWDWLAAMLAASVLRPLTYTVAAIRTDPEPARAVRAFAFLPFYAVWRIYAAVTALSLLGDRPWVRTARAARSQLHPGPQGPTAR